MFGGVPIIGGIESALMGQNNYRARAPSTAPGTEAIRQQMALASRRARAAQHSAVASARGPAAGLMAREGMRRGAMAQQAGLEQGGILQKQLEQNALDQQMKAQEINARIASENSGGLQRLAGTAVGALGGAMMFSDERTKDPIGDKYAAATGGPDDGRRVMWGSGDGYSEPAALPATPAPAPMPPPPAAPQQPAQPSFGQRFGQQLLSGLMQTSDKRAKVLEAENRSLQQALLQVSGVPTTPSMRKSMPASADAAARAKVLPDVTSVRSDGRKAYVSREHSMPLTLPEARRVESMPAGERQVMPPAPVAPRPVQVANMPPPPPVSLASMLQSRIRSDEDSKTGEGGVDMEFPEGVEPKAFRYKPEFSDGDPGVHYGVMAQDLEKSREGAKVVEEDPATGMKQVDAGRLTMLNTAALSDLERRLRRLEGSG
jgi:hypothetical protein